jgi:diguanylate cyclase (GGDEF)-like protein/putative nucleotidyltransferase with HDIG domain
MPDVNTLPPILSVAMFVAAALLAVFFAHIQSAKRQPYLMLWTAAWGFVALHSLSSALSAWVTVAPWQGAINDWLMAAAALLFFCSAQLYSQKLPWIRVLIGAGAAFAVWVTAYHLKTINISPSYGIALVLCGVGWAYSQESRRQETLADLLIAFAFVTWAAVKVAVLLTAQIPGASTVHALELVPELFAAVLMVMMLYEEEKRRVEHNMLALSNLNLATSSFSGGEIQKMLGQALERVLSVARIPSGAFFLHHGEPSGPTSVIAAGLDASFCAAAQEEDLDSQLVSLVSRLGGLVVFRDPGRDASWAVLERDDAFRRFGQIAVHHGLRTVVGISLQAKEHAFGVLLLGTPDARRFTSAELRLLMALGHQIGTAVENSFLVQQTARRSQELHVLNAIGRSLSSTLDPESLFEKIYEEMRRLLSVDDFFIAFYDEARNEMRYELEIAEGTRMPKRTRPAGNHLSEYMLRTRQPVLIRENFSEEVKRMGMQPLRKSGCFCGVPLVLYDRAIAVMVAHSSQDRAFDTDHLEMMRVLASEAAIAIENARLFREERLKSRRLALLNRISRDIITTLNPDEMLSKIGGELKEGLSYDHIGIGTLDYKTREIVIQAEAGRRGGALGRRLPFDGTLVGQVARTGQILLTSDATAQGTLGTPVLDDTATAIALPLVYADQLHGVLYVESSEHCEFSEEERSFLRTLSDLISGALHNAQTFQKAQEQAITDGLTCVKTHRFFMEALSAEWKRATRAGRTFSVMLIDLDRFKFVNDFHGHLEGDLVLQRVARILEQNCRRSDVVARYGGDEFVVLMPETNVEQGRQIATKLRAWIDSDPVLRERNITASFGISTFPLHGSTPQELIQVADSSMYLSKHQGGNTVSTADRCEQNETLQWKREVLEAYLGVTLKRMFTTGPEAYEEISLRLNQFSRALTVGETLLEGSGDGSNGGRNGPAFSGADAEELAAFSPAVLDTVTSLALAIDAKDQFTQGHSLKVAAYAALLAESLGLTEAEIEEVRLGGVLHDVGKVGVPEKILNKNGPLDPEEWESMKLHVKFGGELLKPLRSLDRVQQMVGHHHEHFDGSGYPAGLSGDQIPLGARIIAIADAYDTITSDRTYKKGRSPEEAMAEIERCAGTQFDPVLVPLFLGRLRQLPAPLLEAAPMPFAAPAAPVRAAL